MEFGRRTDSLREVTEEHSCPMCNGTEIATSSNLHSFTYGSGESAVDLTVEVPVRRCHSCGFEYLDEAAEHLRHEAVCRHLGVLSPAEIRRIRKEHKMTRSRFAEVTGLSAASLHRWENGLSMQTLAYDRYIRLLANPYIMRRLESVAQRIDDSMPVMNSNSKRFRALEVTDDLQKQNQNFQLRKAA